MRNNFFSAVAILIGTIAGAGIFGIPYVIAKAGFIPGFLYLLILGFVTLILQLCFGEVVLRTKKYHQITGYAKKYLGNWGKGIVTFSLLVGIYGALLAYMIGTGNFLYVLLGEYLGGTQFLYSMIFFVLASLAILIGIGMIIQVEKVMVGFLLFVVGFIFVSNIKQIQVANFLSVDWSYLFLPYGVLLFAYAGTTAIPQMKRVLGSNKKNLKKGIILGMLILFGVYFLFSFAVVGVSGVHTSEEAITGLSKFVGKKVVIIGALFGILTMTTSFLTLGLALKEMFRFDWGINKVIAWVLACFVPFIIFLLGLTSFIKVIGTAGAIMGGLIGIIILLMYNKAKTEGDVEPAYSLKLPQLFIYFLFLVFGLGIVYQVYYTFLK